MKFTNKYNLDPLIVKACESNYEYKDKQFSVTSIATDYKEILLKRRHNNQIVKDVSDMVWLLFGTSFHEFMEKQEEEYVEVSEPVYKMFCDMVKDKKEEYIADLDGSTHTKYYIKPRMKESHLIYKCKRSNYTLSGYSDLYNILTNMVSDYKTASVNKVLYNDWEDYRKQLLRYCLMLNEMGYPCNKGRIIAFLKDWSASEKLRSPSDYPDSPIYEVNFEFTYEELAAEKEWLETFFEKMEKMDSLEDNSIPKCCDKIRTFGRKSSYAIMKEGRKSAVRVLDTKEKAEEYLLKNNLDNKHYIIERKAEDTRCKLYCDSHCFCNRYIENYANYVLKDNEGKVVAGFDRYDLALDYVNLNPEFKGYKIEVK